MSERDFIYWLSGFLESGIFENGLTKEQLDVIKDHLKLVSCKVTQDRFIGTFQPSKIDTTIIC